MTKSNNTNRRPLYLTVVGLLVLSLGAVFVVRSFGSESGADGFLGGKSCDNPTQVRLSTSPEIQPLLETAAKSLAAKKDDSSACLNFTITSAPSAKVARDVANSTESRPDLWIPDSSLWVSQADDGQKVPTIAVPSIATSPLVLAGLSANFADTSSWLGVFSKAQPALLDPLGQSPGALALLALQAERRATSASDKDIGSVIVPTAQRLGSMAKPYTDPGGLMSRAGQANSKIVVPVSEQSFVTYQEEHPDSELKSVVPKTGTVLLDYPVVVTAQTNDQTYSDAGKALAAELMSRELSTSRDEAGFRDPLVSELGSGRGSGTIVRLAAPSAAVIEKTLLDWTRLSLSAHSLAVIDVSGSMAETVGKKTRWQITLEAAVGGLALFPDNAQLGLWTFSTNIGPLGADFRDLVPIGRLNPAQRQKITTTLLKQQPIKGGGTGLYATAIAAVQAVRSSYDPLAVNTILLFTDGKNDDPNGPSLPQTLQKLEGLKNPAQPVRIIALGMGPDADVNELNQLAAATGGKAYVAKNPADLRDVFIEALQSR
ncbi:VWA domain-containing protein [Kribbella sp. CA-293567]|uniref:VWA domain-containing protein n=1 Tax=Kribbella sp. CA-293567 TaxID=3002436 RepID=UPI0022DDA361|nr:VWA domain-containing protein [Kribbella sp. CA-293567]WBQ03609.1 substrate-binding domain-containing protein [Kribbella sp. CA-293567]